MLKKIPVTQIVILWVINVTESLQKCPNPCYISHHVLKCHGPLLPEDFSNVFSCVTPRVTEISLSDNVRRCDCKWWLFLQSLKNKENIKVINNGNNPQCSSNIHRICNAYSDDHDQAAQLPRDIDLDCTEQLLLKVLLRKLQAKKTKKQVIDATDTKENNPMPQRGYIIENRGDNQYRYPEHLGENTGEAVVVKHKKRVNIVPKENELDSRDTYHGRNRVVVVEKKHHAREPTRRQFKGLDKPETYPERRKRLRKSKRHVPVKISPRQFRRRQTRDVETAKKAYVTPNSLERSTHATIRTAITTEQAPPTTPSAILLNSATYNIQTTKNTIKPFTNVPIDIPVATPATSQTLKDSIVKIDKRPVPPPQRDIIVLTPEVNNSEMNKIARTQIKSEVAINKTDDEKLAQRENELMNSFASVTQINNYHDETVILAHIKNKLVSTIASPTLQHASPKPGIQNEKPSKDVPESQTVEAPKSGNTYEGHLPKVYMPFIPNIYGPLGVTKTNLTPGITSKHVLTANDLMPPRVYKGKMLINGKLFPLDVGNKDSMAALKQFVSDTIKKIAELSRANTKHFYTKIFLFKMMRFSKTYLGKDRQHVMNEPTKKITRKKRSMNKMDTNKKHKHDDYYEPTEEKEVERLKKLKQKIKAQKEKRKQLRKQKYKLWKQSPKLEKKISTKIQHLRNKKQQIQRKQTDRQKLIDAFWKDQMRRHKKLRQKEIKNVKSTEGKTKKKNNRTHKQNKKSNKHIRPKDHKKEPQKKKSKDTKKRTSKKRNKNREILHKYRKNGKKVHHTSQKNWVSYDGEKIVSSHSSEPKTKPYVPEEAESRLEALKDKYGRPIPVLNVADPVPVHALKRHRIKQVMYIDDQNRKIWDEKADEWRKTMIGIVVGTIVGVILILIVILIVANLCIERNEARRRRMIFEDAGLCYSCSRTNSLELARIELANNDKDSYERLLRSQRNRSTGKRANAIFSDSE